MKIIEALKQTKDLQKKADDLREKVAHHSAYMNVETPVYPDQKKQVSQWIQSHSDIMKEILRLRVAIQKTNIETVVGIQLNGKTVNKSIAEWIHRRRDLANYEEKMWRSLTDKNLKEGFFGESQTKVEIIRCYDPIIRDENILMYQTEPSIIDANLEIVNATTDLIE